MEEKPNLIDVALDPAPHFPRFKELADALTASGIPAQVWHSGGGIFGVLIPVGENLEIFMGDIDGDWGADVSDLDEGHLGSEGTGLYTDKDGIPAVAAWAKDLYSRVQAGKIPEGLTEYQREVSPGL